MLVYFKSEVVKSIERPLKSYSHISDDSGRWIELEFCENCGSSVTWTLEVGPTMRGFEGGTSDENDQFPCNMHMWTDSSHPSVVFKSTDTCFARQPPFTEAYLKIMNKES